MSKPAVVIVMGVSGSGKSFLGSRLAAALGWRFLEGDDFHPPANIAKMSAGIPLDDADRAPFLAAIRAEIEASLSRGEGTVIACSALKESYRRTLVVDPSRVKIVHLSGSPALIGERLARREGHFMKASMLPSQLAALEAPRDALVLDAASDPAAMIARVRAAWSI
jgi:gluconokinase